MTYNKHTLYAIDTIIYITTLYRYTDEVTLHVSCTLYTWTIYY